MADNDNYVLLDARGMVLHGYLQGKDPEGELAKDGKTINGPAWGMERFLLKYQLFDLVPPRRIIAVWDAGNDYRRALFPGYKGKRRERRAQVEDALVEAERVMMQAAQKLFAGLGITQVSVSGVEADDVIAYLCSKLPQCAVYTGDQDLVQLAADYPGVQVVMKNEIVGDTYKGIPIGLTRLYKSIAGDDTDEYPGVVGLGEKKFLQLLEAFGQDGMQELEQIVRNADWRALNDVLEGVVGASEDKIVAELYAQREHWHLQYLLASLKPELCEGVRNGKLTEIRWQRHVPAHHVLLDLEREIGLPGLRDRFRQWLPDYVLADNTKEGAAQLKHFAQHMGEGPIVAFDFETYDTLDHQPFQEAKKSGEYVDVLSSEPTGVSFAYGDNYQHVFYMPCNHVDTANFSLENIAWAVQLAADRTQLVAHNATFEYGVSAVQLGIQLPTPWDTRLLASHVDENDSLHLKDLSKRFLGHHQVTYKDTLAKAGAEDMRGVSGKQVLTYGCDDSICAAHLFDLFWLITTCEGTWEFIREREFEFIHEQERSFLTGVTGDMDVIARLDAEATETVETGRARIQDLLLEHCSDYNVQGAENLYKDLATYEEAKANTDNRSDDDIDEILERLWEKVSEGSRYIPYQEIHEEGPEWKPTPKKLSEVAVKLNLPPIDKDTKKHITAWASDALELTQTPGWQEPTLGPGPSFMFVELLTGAAHLLKLRQGPEYEELVNFCQGVLGAPEGKVTTVGDELNFGSPQQMQYLLYAKLGLPIRVRSKVQKGSGRDVLGLEGSPSTDNLAVAAALAEDVEPGEWRYELLEHYGKVKTAMTSLSLFLKPMPKWVHPADGRIHPGILNCGTVTRRPSGSSPNFLQLTKRDGGELRGFVRPLQDDHVIISADFNGQELRITASEAKDPALLDAYTGAERKDVHSVTASAIAPAFFKLKQFRLKYGLPDDYASIPAVSYDDFIDALHDDELKEAVNSIRKAAKGVNFLMTYMGGYTTLARKLLIKEDLAKQLMDQTFARYTRLKPWQQETIEFARRHGYTQTAYGTRRHLTKDILSLDDGLRSRMERQAVNFTIQGCAADVLKLVMSEAHRTGLYEDTGAVIIAPVYDELAASVPYSAAWEYCSRLKEIMEVTPPGHAVPMVAEFSLSANSWGDQIEIGADITEEKVYAALDESKQKRAKQ